MPTYFETELALRAAQIRQLKKQNAALVEALKKAPRPMTSLSAKELKANWKAVDHWFAIYDSWVYDVVKQALAQTK